MHMWNSVFAGLLNFGHMWIRSWRLQEICNASTSENGPSNYAVPSGIVLRTYSITSALVWATLALSGDALSCRAQGEWSTTFDARHLISRHSAVNIWAIRFINSMRSSKSRSAIPVTSRAVCIHYWATNDRFNVWTILLSLFQTYQTSNGSRSGLMQWNEQDVKSQNKTKLFSRSNII